VTDARELADVLQDPEVGNYDVTTVINREAHEIEFALEDFFANRKRDDFLVVYLSCHGIKDASGQLFFAATNTKLSHLRATAMRSDFVNDLIDDCRSNRILVLLDCCYSGAFARGAKHDATVHMDDHLHGEGRVVLTASGSMEYSFEGETTIGEGQRSVFTRALVDGLATGEADLDWDGLISVDDLYGYVHEYVLRTQPGQKPEIRKNVEGQLVVARSTRLPQPAELPAGVADALASPISSVREAIVPTLSTLLDSKNRALALAAELALRQLSEDDSRRIAAAAESALRTSPGDGSAPVTPVEIAQPANEARREYDKHEHRLDRPQTATSAAADGNQRLRAGWVLALVMELGLLLYLIAAPLWDYYGDLHQARDEGLGVVAIALTVLVALGCVFMFAVPHHARTARACALVIALLSALVAALSPLIYMQAGQTSYATRTGWAAGVIVLTLVCTIIVAGCAYATFRATRLRTGLAFSS
jgi:uncharacterized caspase-like protein